MLEGIGLVQKKNKNKIQWIGNIEEADPQTWEESSQIQRELEELAQEEEKREDTPAASVGLSHTKNDTRTGRPGASRSAVEAR